MSLQLLWENTSFGSEFQLQNEAGAVCLSQPGMAGKEWDTARQDRSKEDF